VRPRSTTSSAIRSSLDFGRCERSTFRRSNIGGTSRAVGTNRWPISIHRIRALQADPRPFPGRLTGESRKAISSPYNKRRNCARDLGFQQTCPGVNSNPAAITHAKGGCDVFGKDKLDRHPTDDDSIDFGIYPVLIKRNRVGEHGISKEACNAKSGRMGPTFGSSAGGNPIKLVRQSAKRERAPAILDQVAGPPTIFQNKLLGRCAYRVYRAHFERNSRLFPRFYLQRAFGITTDSPPSPRFFSAPWFRRRRPNTFLHVAPKILRFARSSSRAN
jgi:hypothetical protein